MYKNSFLIILFLVTLSLSIVTIMSVDKSNIDIKDTIQVDYTITINHDLPNISSVIELKDYCEKNNMSINEGINPQTSCINY